MKKCQDYQISRIKYIWEGSLGIGSAPGKNYKWVIQKRNLQQDLKRIKQYYQIQLIVCLLDEHEMKQIGVANQHIECQKIGVLFWHYPIQDMVIPDDVPKFRELVHNTVHQYLNKGKNVLVHCHSGAGRSGLFAISCLLSSGFSFEQATQKIKQTTNKPIEQDIQNKFLVSLSFKDN